MLQKGGYLYEYLDDCKRFDETSSPKKEDFYVLPADAFEKLCNMCLEI